MNNINKIKDVLNLIKIKIDNHEQYKKSYNKQFAFDFSLFNFFNIGENKTSQILAYFLNPQETHGQGAIFLEEFVKLFYGENIDISNAKITCEKTITNNRRIDIYIELENHIIAVENKIWADDLDNQIKDYSDYLKKEKKGKGNFLLIYLTPNGTMPSTNSIEEKDLAKLEEVNQFKTISYAEDISLLISKWLGICEANNVSHFIKEFKNYLKNKFSRNNYLIMSDQIQELIYSNKEEVQVLVKTYKEIEAKLIKKVNDVGEILYSEDCTTKVGVELVKVKPFNYEGQRIYKYGLARGSNKIWIQLVQKDIELFFHLYFPKETSIDIKKLAQESNLKQIIMIGKDIAPAEIANLFIKHVKLANELF